MSTTEKEPASQVLGPSFAETALRLGGKGEEEVRRMGAVDRADDESEMLFAQRRRTVNSPVHRAVWSGSVPLELFQPAAPTGPVPAAAAMERRSEVARKHRDAKTMYNAQGKVSQAVLDEIGAAGFFGMLIDPKYGGQGARIPEFAQFQLRMSVIDSSLAGMSSVHSCIGAVDPINAFGTQEQKDRFLPHLASGKFLSGFGLTEPNAGSDLTALRTTAVDVGNDELEINGEKLFITNAEPGRVIGLVVMYNGKPAVVITELPQQENEHFQVVRYGLYALKHSYNNGLRFRNFRVPKANLLKPAQGDGLTIAYHGLNLGRVTLCASAAAMMRIMLADILPWAKFRKTYGQAIVTRELVKRRIARLAGLIAGADALVEWCARLIDEGYRGELECIVAKIFGSESLKEAAVEILMKTHGGRSFIHGHLFGDYIHDHLAPCIYEGEGEMLAMGFFKSLVKEHGVKFFEPIGKALQKHGMKTLNPANPVHLARLRKELTSYGKWWMSNKFTGSDGGTVPGLDPRLAEHVAFAQQQFAKHRGDLSTTMRTHQLKLADRQCRMVELSQRVQDTVVLLVTALWGGRQKNEVSLLAADILCQDLRRKLTGARPTDRYFKQCSQLADRVIAGEYEALAGGPRA